MEVLYASGKSVNISAHQSEGCGIVKFVTRQIQCLVIDQSDKRTPQHGNQAIRLVLVESIGYLAHRSSLACVN